MNSNPWCPARSLSLHLIFCNRGTALLSQHAPSPPGMGEHHTPPTTLLLVWSSPPSSPHLLQSFIPVHPWAQGRDGFGLTTFHKSHPSNSCPVSGAALALLCSRGCRFLRCYGYRRVILDDHLRTLGGPAGGRSVPAVTPRAQDLTVEPPDPPGAPCAAGTQPFRRFF